MKLTLDVIFRIASEEFTYSFMKAADLWNDSKQLARHSRAEMEWDEKTKTLQEFVDFTKDSIEKDGTTVVFIGFKTPVECASYIKPNVNSITNGYEWAVFETLLINLGYKAETNQHRMVTKVY